MDGPPDLELGAGVRAWFVGYSREHHPEAPDPAGLFLEHPAATETGRCAGSVFWWRPTSEAGGPVWRRESESPLTLSPSIRCHCGFHGFIREGKWVPG